MPRISDLTKRPTPPLPARWFRRRSLLAAAAPAFFFVPLLQVPIVALHARRPGVLLGTRGVGPVAMRRLKDDGVGGVE
jgi:hypothetical protein